MNGVQNYRKRAAECLAYARKTNDDNERDQLLSMARILTLLAVKFEQTAETKNRRSAKSRGKAQMPGLMGTA
jgi:hypothetical protein